TSESSLDSNKRNYDKPDTKSSNDNLFHEHSEISSVDSDDFLKRKFGDNRFAMSSCNNNVTKNSGFSTAGSRSIIAVSEDSLIKARKSLDDNTNAMLKCNDNELKSFGFSTGNGRNLPSISETSLNKARKSFDDITFSKSIRRDNNVLKDSRFSTANGHSIEKISDVSLKRARKILDGDLRQGSILQEKLQSNIIDLCDSELTFNAVDKRMTTIILDKNKSSNSKSRLKETPLIHSRLGLKNKKAKISSKNIVHPLHPNKRRRLHPNVSRESHNSQSKISEYNSIKKLFDLKSPLKKRFRLKDFVSNYPLDFSISYIQELGISEEVINITSKNAITYRFTWPEGKSQENTRRLSVWGPDEALSCLIESGANSDLINENWVCNHYQWIVWKIASMVRSFPHEFRNWWNPKKVLDQLQYREINNAHRSALKMIIEGDAAASMPMILCVSDIIKEDTSHVTPGENNVKGNICKITYILELTDMWYKIRADIDLPLQRAIIKSKLQIGCKVEICGAKIVGGPVGIPALEVSNSIRLKLSANSTKLAHWDAKLGFNRVCPYATLRSLCPDGGYIFAIDILVLRKYPITFRETMIDGTIINRNEQEEEYAKSKHDVRLNIKIQSLINEYEILHKPNTHNKSKGISKKQTIQDTSKITSGEQLYEIMQDCLELSKFWQDLSSEQSEWLQNYIQKKEQEKASHMNEWVYDNLEKLNYTRKVIPYFKVRVCDYNTSTINRREGIINVWQPDELLFNTIKEGRRYKVYSLTSANNQNYQMTSLSPIRLSSMKGSTIWKEEFMNTNNNALSFYSSRTISHLDELQRQDLNIEVDVVVYILVVGDLSIGQRFGKSVKIQSLLVTDNSGRLAQIEIKNISTYMEDILLKPKNVLILLNLQYRAYDPKYGIYILSTCDNTEIKISSREEYTRQAKGNLEQWIKNNSDLVNKCEAKAIELCRPYY
ncbi:17602_t:CDS:10, partial [Funneliformis geosporum]